MRQYLEQKLTAVVMREKGEKKERQTTKACERLKKKKKVFSVGQYKTSKCSAIRLFLKQQTDKQVMTGGTVQVKMLN